MSSRTLVWSVWYMHIPQQSYIYGACMYHRVIFMLTLHLNVLTYLLALHEFRPLIPHPKFSHHNFPVKFFAACLDRTKVVFFSSLFLKILFFYIFLILLFSVVSSYFRRLFSCFGHKDTNNKDTHNKDNKNKDTHNKDNKDDKKSFHQVSGLQQKGGC